MGRAATTTSVASSPMANIIADNADQKASSKAKPAASANAAPTPFVKMHGTGNDFVVFDARQAPLILTSAQVQQVADRRYGVGCDQVIVMEPSSKADIRMRIYNADGGEVASCGNASRCVAWRVMQENGQKTVTIETGGGLLVCEAAGERRITVNMGKPRLEWNEIPLNTMMDTLHLQIGIGPLSDPVGVSMGNPHAVFFVPRTAEIPLEYLGPVFERHVLFPERANIGVAEILDAQTLRLRVWERGTGETLACGTGACAAVVAAARRGLTGRNVTVRLPGGALAIHWREDQTVHMTGEIAEVFHGEVSLQPASAAEERTTP